MQPNPEVVGDATPMGAYGDPTDSPMQAATWMDTLARVLIAYAPSIEKLASMVVGSLLNKGGCPNCKPKAEERPNA